MRNAVIGLLLLFFAENVMAKWVKLIELHYQKAETIITLLQPLLKPGESLTGKEQHLVLKASAETFSRIRNLIHQLDKSPLVFNISLKTESPYWLQKKERISLQTPSINNERFSRSLNVRNNESIYFAFNKNVPVLSGANLAPWPFFESVQYQRHIQKRSIELKPLLQGNKVLLTIKLFNDEASLSDSQQFNEATFQTRLVLPLDQWVPLTPYSEKTNVNFHHLSTKFVKGSNLYIKVTRSR